MNTALRETVISYVPRLAITRKLKDPSPLKGPEIDHFLAAVMLVDVSGFTSLTEALAARGPEGAEEMTRALNRYFNQLIELITLHGGDIVKFAGDAMLIVWPAQAAGEHLSAQAGWCTSLEEATLRATQCGWAMQAGVGEVEALPGIRLAFKATISAGAMAMAHVGGVYGRWEFVVMGQALEDMAPATRQATAGAVDLTPQAFALIGDRLQVLPLELGCQRVCNITFGLEPKSLPLLPIGPEIEAALAGFLPGAIRSRLAAGQSSWLGEMRQLTVLFVNLPELNHRTPIARAQEIMQALQTSMYRYEGSINKMSVDEKGISLVGALGLPPLAHYDDPARGVGAALAIKSKLDAMSIGCSIGIASGRAFCGEVGNSLRREYTVMGDVINLAARLMQAARGQIRCDASTYLASERSFQFEALPSIPLKGKTGLFAVFCPQGKLPQRFAPDVEIVGRNAEREALGDRLQELKRERKGGTVLIEGDAGSGKSSLISYLAGQASALRLRVFYGIGDAIEKSNPYHAWTPVVQDLFQVREADDLDLRRQRVMERLALTNETPKAPLLNAVLPLEFPESDFTAGLEDQTRSRLTHELVARLFQAVAEVTPTVFILDDAHWVDSASWSLACALAQKVYPALLVLAARPLQESRPEELEGLLANGTQLTLGPLDQQESVQLACKALGVTSIPASAAEMIADRGGGHPLFVEEIAFALRDSQILVVEGTSCRLAPGTGDLSEVSLPSSVSGIITGRIDRLLPDEQLTLKVASVLGRVFDYRVLADIHPIESQRLLIRDHLEKLSRQDLTSHEPLEAAVKEAFKSAITRDVAYNLLLFSQRKQIHQAVAEWYERQFEEDLSSYCTLLAHHWTLAEVPGKAIHYLEAAGTAAAKSYAYKEAAEYYSKALDLDLRIAPSELDQPMGSDEAKRRRLRLEEFLGKVYKGMGRQLEARQHLESALALSQELKDLQTEGQVLTSIGHLCSIGNLNQQAEEALCKAEALLFDAGDGQGVLRCLQFLARVYFRMGDPGRAIACSRRALDFAATAPGSLDAAVHLAYLGNLYVSCDVPGLPLKERMAAGIGYLRSAVESKRRSGDRLSLNNNLNLLGNALWISGQFQEAREAFAETLALSVEIGFLYDQVCAQINLAINSHELGDFPAMARYSKAAAQDALSGKYVDYAAIALTIQALASQYLATGDNQRGESAESLLAQAQEQTEKLDPGARSALALTTDPYLAEFQLLAGQIEAGLDTAKRNWERIRQTGVREYEQRTLTLLGEGHLANGNTAEAAAAFQEAWDLGNEIEHLSTLARANLGLGIIAAAREAGAVADAGAASPSTARQQLETAYQQASKINSSYLAGKIALALANCLENQHDPAGAREWLGAQGQAN